VKTSVEIECKEWLNLRFLCVMFNSGFKNDKHFQNFDLFKEVIF